MHNFMVYEHQVVQLYEQGIVRLEGVNKDDSRAESNMAGKSTIIEAEARKHGCLVKISRHKKDSRISEPPRSENIEKTIQEYARSKKLTRLGLEIFR